MKRSLIITASVLVALAFFLVVALPPLLDSAGIGSLPVEPSGKAVENQTTLAPGTKVLALWEGDWWEAEVLSVQQDGSVEIHYTNWGPEWDETVSRDRLQLP